MKIVYVSKLAPHLGLPHIFEVARRLVGYGHRVTVLTAATHVSQPALEQVEGIDVRAIATAPRTLRSQSRIGFFATRLPFYLMVPHSLARYHPDADVVVEDVAPLWSPRLPVMCRRLNIPLVYTTHNAYPRLRDWWSAYGGKGVVGYLLDQQLRRDPACAALYSDGRWTAQNFQDLSCPVEWIPNGVDVSRFRPNGEASVEGALRIIQVARFVPLKNHETLLRAVAEFQGHVHLTLLGSGPHERTIRRLVEELNLTDAVTFRGHVAGDELVTAYQRAELFCLPSRYEGLPHSLLEAMASGLPVIVADIPAVDGIVEEAFAWRVPSRSITGWVNALNEAIAARSRLPTMGRDARKMAEEQFSWERCARSVETLLLRTVERQIAVEKSVRHLQC